MCGRAQIGPVVAVFAAGDGAADAWVVSGDVQELSLLKN